MVFTIRQMNARFPRRGSAALMFLAVVAVLSGAVWWLSFTSALNNMEERGRVDLSMATDRLTGRLQSYRELAVLLSDHPTLVPLVLTGQGDKVAAKDLMQRMSDKTGSLNIQLVRNGELLVSSGEPQFDQGVGAALVRAMTGALGTAHFVDAAGIRNLVYAAPVFQPGGPARGAVVVSIDLRTIEWNWPADPAPLFFTDEHGVIFVTNRSELVLTAPTGAADLQFPEFSEKNIGRHALWTIAGQRFLPDRALHLTQSVPTIDMTVEILLDVTPAEKIAALQAAVAAALCLAFGAMFFVATERRRAFNERLELESAANAKLETRVQKRTKELSSANSLLRREVREREEAEAALRQAQSDLVQAGKLAALGQMSAGISHELNQPLMAIRSFAENAEVFLSRGETGVTAENLSRISELSRRMGRIIKNLRAFARQEMVPIGDVDLVAVVEAVLELARPRAASAEIEVVWEKPADPCFVRGGDVRLQQVVMNLVTNAMDAMSESAEKRLEIMISQSELKIVLAIRDTGPGIQEPNKIFDPFYTTKEVGQSEGMGLGLSISYGLVQSFGGAIKGRNLKRGGAEFTVELTASGLEQAA